MTTIRLDDLYRMTVHIYSEQNATRPVSATFAHFVEVCGMLTIFDRRKKREGVEVTDALCKALGWYFPLLAKLRVRSVEDLVFRKYPYACPYCRLCPHDDRQCKTVRGTASTVDHSALRALYERNRARKPVGLGDWQRMFQDIYPRTPDDRARSTLGLFEELGELAESIRVHDRYPKYFAGEAADIFTYLMGLANEYSIRLLQETGEELRLEEEFIKRYPGLCTLCGFQVCICPSIPPATVGRLAKELDISDAEDVFALDPAEFSAAGAAASAAVLEKVGGYSALSTSLPVDRGDANRAMVMLCLRLAEAVSSSQPELAKRFRSAALQLGSSALKPGSPLDAPVLSKELSDAVREAWRHLDPAARREAFPPTSSLAFELGSTLGRVRVLFVYASPLDEAPLRVMSELRAIREAVKLAGRDKDIQISDLPAATADDLRRAFLTSQYEIVHFAGHAEAGSVVLEAAEGKAVSVPISALAELLAGHKSVRVAILNACDSLAGLSTPIAPYTIGMDAPIHDESAIEFARGFYDAIAAGRDIDLAVDEGKRAAALKGLPAPAVKVLRS